MSTRTALSGALLVLLTLAGPASAGSWRFALIGDTPYSEQERRDLPQMLQQIGDSGAAFVVHVGDIKNGRDRCDDALYEDRRQLFEASPAPFVLVPGDNEWTDCDRLSAGAYDPQERLGHLRRVFFTTPQSLGQKKIRLERQSAAYPEHVRFRLGPVLFVGLNVPGSNNNRGNGAQPGAEFQARMPQVLAWLREGYALARQDKLRAVVLLFQANPAFVNHARGLAHSGYQDFLDVLRQEALAFPGQSVAVHGDTHMSRIDHPMRDESGRVIERFTRVETFGYPIPGWTEGVIDDDAPAVLRFTPHPWGQP